MFNKDDRWDSLYDYARKLVESGVQYSELEKQLLTKENDPLIVHDIVRQLKRVHYAVKRKSGLQKIAFGSLFLVIGFFITCVNFHSNQSFTIVMYGFTSLGLFFIFWGLYDVVG